MDKNIEQSVKLKSKASSEETGGSRNQKELYKFILSEIRRALSEARITQSEIGLALGIKQSAVSSLLSGKSRMSLDQFLVLAELVGIRPQKLLQSVHNKMTQIVPLSFEVETILYKSDLHLICFCSATQEISADDLPIEDVGIPQIQGALEDLAAVGLLTKTKEGTFVQKNPRLIYRPSSRMRGSRAHANVVKRSWEYFDKRFNDKAFTSTKFNSYMIDRFSKSQTKEIDASLWQVYERIQSIREKNLANGYTEDTSMPLWNIHLMLTTPFDGEK